MKHNIIPALAHLAIPLDKITLLPGNPHTGNIEAMAASLSQLGQHRPVVARGNADDGGSAIVGNHMFQAAQLLGWTHIAVAWVDEDEKTSIARALMDNRVAELGEDDPAKLALMVPEVIEFFPEMFDTVGWDDFEVASWEMVPVYDAPKGYDPPRMELPRNDRTDNEPRYEKPIDVSGKSETDLVKTGAGDTDDKRQAIIQYTLVFSSSDQQHRWHKFVAFLREDPGIDGDTTVDRLMDFIEQHADF
jgi:hypothetical protein